MAPPLSLSPVSPAALLRGGLLALLLLPGLACDKSSTPSTAGTAGAAASGAAASGAAAPGAPATPALPGAAASAPAGGAFLQIVPGGGHTCVILKKDSLVRCWGRNQYGELGVGDTEHRGNQPGQMATVKPIDFGKGRSVKTIALGYQHGCAVLDTGAVKCWGRNSDGQLGLGDTSHRGDAPGEMGDALPAVDLGKGRTAKAVAAGYATTCALLDDGSVKCWGLGDDGQLGIGRDEDRRGNSANEMGDNLPAVDLGKGRTATSITVSYYNACARLDDGSVKCWGINDEGQLGLGTKENHGDKSGRMGEQLPATDLGKGRTVKVVQAGEQRTCALLDDSSVKCWGKNEGGVLGLGDTRIRGDLPGQMGDALPTIDLGKGRTARAIAVGDHHTCALLDNGALKCWGQNQYGQLGSGDMVARGDGPGEMGDALPAVDLGKGRTAVAIAAGAVHTCAVLDTGALKCWGQNQFGRLGLDVGNDRGSQPDQMGDALPEVRLP